MILPPTRNPLLDPPAWPTERRFRSADLRKPWAQASAVFVTVTIFAWASRFWPPGPWNAAWMIVAPFLIGSIANAGAARVYFGVALVILSIVSLMANEAAAHLLFATCLYD